MPNESQDLHFDKAELASVANHYLSLTGHHMSEFTPQNVIVGCEPSRALRIVYLENSASNIGHVDWDERQLKDALICYCRDNDVSIPQSAQKTVHLQNNEVVMNIRRTTTQKVA